MKEETPPIVAKGARRRSTRLAHAIRLAITWRDSKGKARAEETATLSINCHGCRYFSRSRLRKNAKINVQIGAAAGESSPMPLSFPARVAWVRKSRRLNGMYMVGVEFETPQNFWHIEDVPEDWQSFSPSTREDPVALATEIERLLQFVHEGTYYQLLGVQPDTARPEMKRKFYHLASKFHPDHHMDHPERTARLLVLMDALTVAYKTLSDEESKGKYDFRLAGRPEKESTSAERYSQECLGKARECLAVKNYIGSILWLRRLVEAEPNSSGYRAMLGSSLAALPEYRHEAAEQFQRAIEIDPLHVAAHFQYAQLLEQMKFPARARPHYLRVLELDANHPDALDRLRRLDAAAPRAISRSGLLGRLAGRY